MMCALAVLSGYETIMITFYYRYQTQLLSLGAVIL